MGRTIFLTTATELKLSCILRLNALWLYARHHHGVVDHGVVWLPRWSGGKSRNPFSVHVDTAGNSDSADGGQKPQLTVTQAGGELQLSNRTASHVSTEN